MLIVVLLQRQEELIYIIAYDILFGKVIYANLINYYYYYFTSVMRGVIFDTCGGGLTRSVNFS